MNLVQNHNQLKCTHKYLTICLTNPQPPGFADFLRGTITLFKYCEIYNYKLYLDNSHPIFNYLKESEFIESDNRLIVHERLPSSEFPSYDHIDQGIKNLFEINESFTIMTNGFYTNINGVLDNWGNISENAKLYVKNILIPNEILKKKISEVLNKINLSTTDEYHAIHLRLGDNYLHNDIYDENLFNNVNSKINNLIQQNSNNKYILFTDTTTIGKKLKLNNPSLYYFDNLKIHLGDLKNNKEGIIDTLVDFFIMSKSLKIYYLNHSGFSCVISCLCDIPYENL